MHSIILPRMSRTKKDRVNYSTVGVVIAWAVHCCGWLGYQRVNGEHR